MVRSLALFSLALFASSLAQGAPDSATISAILENRIVEQKDGVAIIVGVTEPEGHRVVGFGPTDINGIAQVNADTVFEIGSVTKVFSSMILADMARNGELRLDDPVQSLLPDAVTIPVWQDRAITLRHLSMHTSALPRLPGNLAATDPLNPYADYTTENMYAFLNAYDLTRPPEEKYDYSNLGVGLLGHALSHSNGQDYEAMVEARILSPLGMNDTGIALTEDQRKRFATGHNALLMPAPPWDIPALAGAGALRSTVNDMLIFLDTHLARGNADVSGVQETMLASLFETEVPTMRVALGWHVFGGGDDQIVFHTGMTGGYSAFVGYRASTSTGVVVLANTARPYMDIGRHLLNDAYDLKVARATAQVDSALFEFYAGQYQLTPNLVLSVFHKGDDLYIQATGQSEVPMSAASNSVFFNEAVGVEITFDHVEGKPAPSLTLRQAGQTLPAPRID